MHRGPRYFEVDIDVGSSKSAASVVGLVQGALKGLVIDMAITLEGHTKVHCFPLQTSLVLKACDLTTVMIAVPANSALCCWLPIVFTNIFDGVEAK